MQCGLIYLAISEFHKILMGFVLTFNLLFYQFRPLCWMNDSFAKNPRTVAQHDQLTAHATSATAAAVVAVPRWRVVKNLSVGHTWVSTCTAHTSSYVGGVVDSAPRVPWTLTETRLHHVCCHRWGWRNGGRETERERMSESEERGREGRREGGRGLDRATMRTKAQHWIARGKLAIPNFGALTLAGRPVGVSRAQLRAPHRKFVYSVNLVITGLAE